MLMTFKTYLQVLFQLCTYIAVFPVIFAETKSVSFSDKTDCKAYRHYFESGSDVYKAVWNGESYPTYCSLRFAMRGIDTYKICAEVTTFKLECELFGDEKRQLKFYWGVSQKENYYDCKSSLPITYCHEDLLYMHLEPRYNDIRDSNSRIRITVTAELVSKYGDSYSTSAISSSNTGILVGVVVGIFVFMFIICIAICKRRATLRQNAAGSTAFVQRQGNNVYVATTAPYQQNQFTQQMGYPHGQQSVPFVQYPVGATNQPNQYPPISAGQTPQPGYQPIPTGQSSQTGYQPVPAGQTPQPGHYGQTPAPANQHYYGVQGQYATQNQHPNESKFEPSAPPPTYSDVVEKGTEFRQ